MLLFGFAVLPMVQILCNMEKLPRLKKSIRDWLFCFGTIQKCGSDVCVCMFYVCEVIGFVD